MMALTYHDFLDVLAQQLAKWVQKVGLHILVLRRREYRVLSHYVRLQWNEGSAYQGIFDVS